MKLKEGYKTNKELDRRLANWKHQQRAITITCLRDKTIRMFGRTGTVINRAALSLLAMPLFLALEIVENAIVL